MAKSDAFPALKRCAKIGDPKTPPQSFFDVKWYPFPTADNDQIFAVCGTRDVFVCRANDDDASPYDCLRWWRDPDAEDADADRQPPSYNSIAWTFDATTGNPLLCLAGFYPHSIRILDVAANKCERTLAGHGKAITDLAVSPLSPQLLASAAEDLTVRLWNLAPEHAIQPCVAIFAGGGHTQQLLAMSFHENGKWLLTGGADTAVALWSVPTLEELDRGTARDRQREIREPVVYHYPHFYSTEIHADYVDNVYFYNDLIISRCSKADNTAQNEIFIWQIDGFDPEMEPLTNLPVPQPGVATRSAFPHDSIGFRRLLTLDFPSTDRFYLRFALLHQPGLRPMIAAGNQNSKFSFWDLERLQEGLDLQEKEKRGRKKKHGATAKGSASSSLLSISAAAKRVEDLRHDEEQSDSLESNSETATSATATPAPSIGSSSEPAPQSVAKRIYQISDRYTPVPPHHTFVAHTQLLAKHHFQVQQMAWSPDGKWLVAACDQGMVCFLGR